MRRIFALSISTLLLSLSTLSQEKESQTAGNPVSLGIELSGPVIYALDSSNLNYEVSVRYRINQKYYVVIEPGIGSYSYSQYNYEYTSSGSFIRAGIDINMLKTKEKPGNHYAGIGLRYGISLFNHETPSASYSNYWGNYDFSLESKFIHAHFLEASGGVKAELFKNILIGWTFRVRLLVYQSAGKENRPLMIPGLGVTEGGLQSGLSYHLIWILPFSKNR